MDRAYDHGVDLSLEGVITSSVSIGDLQSSLQASFVIEDADNDDDDPSRDYRSKPSGDDKTQSPTTYSSPPNAKTTSSGAGTELRPGHGHVHGPGVGIGVGLGVAVGEGVYRNDEELIDMLSRPPKTIPALRTKSSFQEFFRGMKSSRMLSLLERTYSSVSADAEAASLLSEEQRAAKIKKRMDIVRDVLVDWAVGEATGMDSIINTSMYLYRSVDCFFDWIVDQLNAVSVGVSWTVTH
jgi:hypothetical protein